MDDGEHLYDLLEGFETAMLVMSAADGSSPIESANVCEFAAWRTPPPSALPGSAISSAAAPITQGA